MLFELKELKSKYDFGEELPLFMATLSSLSKELCELTEKIYSFHKEGRNIIFHQKDNNGNTLYIDFEKVSKSTLFRSENEIKEILYRKANAQGIEQKQFSLTKRLKELNIHEGSIEEYQKGYYQILYFFYILNYFVFPNINIFKSISNSNISFEKSYDEGTRDGKVVSFILKNLFEDEKIFNYFINKQKLLSKQQDILTLQIKYLFLLYDDKIDIKNFIKNIEFHTEHNSHENPLINLLEYLFNYNELAYCKDLLINIKQNEMLFKFDNLIFKPPKEWKKRYIKLEDVNSFLSEQTTYQFCKQVNNDKISKREIMKFIDSNAIKFVNKFIKYDLAWMEDFNVDNGLFIEKKDNELVIYALKLAVIVNTYYELITSRNSRIKAVAINSEIAFGSTLQVNRKKENYFPATLPIRLFLLACHSQYLNAISDGNYYDHFKTNYLNVESMFLEIIINSNKYRTFDNKINYLVYVSNYILDLIDKKASPNN